MLEKVSQHNVLLSEREKLEDDYLRSEIDASIASCVTVDKVKVAEAYKIRNGVRDAKDFEYLWTAYGIEFPAEMRHIPVLRAIFDSLVGQAIMRPLKPHITCDDTASIDHIFNEHRNAILKEVMNYWDSKLRAATIMAEQTEEGTEVQQNAKEFLDQLQKRYNSGGFQADLEKDSKHILQWAIQRFKVKSKIMTMAEDLVTSGQAYYQIKVVQKGKKPINKIVNPLNIFYTKGTDVKFIKDCDRVVIRERIPVSVAWTLYGHKMKKEDQDRFVANWGKYIVNSQFEIMDYQFGSLEAGHKFPIQDLLNTPMTDISYVEWKANTREEILEPEESHVEGVTEDRIMKLRTRYKFKLDRFEGTRVGEDIYVEMGRSKYVVRDPDDPENVSLSVNGICYNDRNGEPYSLVLKTKDLADKIDILHYHAEALLALSGSKALFVNYADIPAWMGVQPQQRVMKWLGYVKQGIAIVDLAQEGVQGNGKFQQYSDIDLSLSNAIITIFDMIDRLEATGYKVTGVSRQSVGQVTQSDGKGTSQIAIQGSEIVTAPLFATLDEIIEQYLTDLVNACRISYSEGIQGKILLGEEGQKIFSIKSEKFNLAHLNVHINTDGETQRDLDEVKAVAHKLIDNQLIDAKLSVDLVTIKSLTEIKQKIKESFENKDAEGKQQMMQELENYKAELDKTKKALEAMESMQLEVKERELAIRDKEASQKAALKNKELDNKMVIDNEKLINDDKRIDLEALQLAYPSGGNNKEIRNN